MRAVVITQAGGPEVLEVREVATPAPQGEWVRVRVRAAGLNRADLMQRAGGYPAPPGTPADIPGLEFAGEIDALGPLARRWSVGQRVMGLAAGGAQAEYIVAHEGLLMSIPDNLDFVQAAGVPEVFITAHDALFTQAGLHMGERVLIHAVGSGVGTAALQLARAAGASTFGTARTSDKLDRARQLGLDLPLADAGFAQAIEAHTSGNGVHVVLDLVGAPYLEQNIAALAMWGRIVLLGMMGGAQASINLGVLMGKRGRIFASTLRTRSLEEKLTATRRFASEVLPLLERGIVRPIIDQTFSLDAVRAAHVAMAANQNFGKLVLTLL